jgi:hypothetical protein
MIPHLVDFLIKYNDCAIMETDKKMFPIMDNLTPARRSVCPYDTSCSTTAAASGSKSASFHAREVDPDPVLYSAIDLIPQSGHQLLAANESGLRPVDGWSATLPLQDYVRVARDSGGTMRTAKNKSWSTA